MTVILMLAALSLFLVLESFFRRQLPARIITGIEGSGREPSPATLPQEFALATNHLWTKQEEGGTVKPGLDGFLPLLPGPPDKVLLPSKDETLEQGGLPVLVRSSDNMLRLESPVPGSVAETHQEELDNPTLVAKDPYGEGWLLRGRNQDAFDEFDGTFAILQTRNS